MKKILTLALLLTVTLLISCGGTDEGVSPTNDPSDTPPASLEPGKTYYIITDYYNEDGSYSELGLALEEVNSEKALALSGGEIFIVSDRQYMVTAETLTLSFYTQSSLSDVIQWWNDYVKIWSEDGIISEVK